MNPGEEIWKKLDQLGEEAVQRKLDHGQYGERKKPHVQAWLRRKREAREALAGHRQETREEETLRVAKESNTLAAHANNLSSKANLVSAIALIVASLALLLSVVLALLGRGDQQTG